MAEEVKWKKPSRPQGVPVWSHHGAVCIGEMLKNTVRLTFPNGARLKDPNRLFNARLDSNTVRAIDFHEGEQVHENGLKSLVTEAARLNAKSARTPRASKGKLHTTVNVDENLSNRVAPRLSDSTAFPIDRGDGQARSQLVPGGVVHKLPTDLHKALNTNPIALKVWMDITPLARNEFICWVEDAKQETTRQRRIRRTQEELEKGQRRPCCWPGCKHRERTHR